MNPLEAMEFMSQRIKQTRNNAEFLATMNDWCFYAFPQGSLYWACRSTKA
jgi:hypothetical protein